MENNNKWKRNIFFVLATIGAAVGLGNLWRFPYMAYENGGAAFFIPFILCYFLVGLPIILLEFGMGLWSKGSVAQAFQKRNYKTTWIGWWILINSIVIVFYYTVVLAWSLQYMIYSFTEAWGTDTIGFFYGNVLRITESPFQIGGLNMFTTLCLLVIWVLVYFVINSGLKGLSRVLAFTVPVPFLLVVILAIRGITLPGGTDGLEYLFVPKLDKLFSIGVWGAAASQVILSLSLGMGQMVAYASMKKDNSKVIKSGFSLIAGDFAFSLFSGIAVFTTLGFLAFSQNVQLTDLKLEGPTLAFITYPAAISNLPLAPLWGVLFFLMLVLLGIDSIFAVAEANLTDLKNAFPKITKKKLVLIFCTICFLGGILFTSGSGIFWLDIVDHWVAYFSIFSIIILQCLVFGFSKSINEIGRNIGNRFFAKVFSLWKIWIAVVLPLVILIILGSKFKTDFLSLYNGYPILAILIGGWGVFILSVLIGLLLGKIHNRTISNTTHL